MGRNPRTGRPMTVTVKLVSDMQPTEQCQHISPNVLNVHSTLSKVPFGTWLLQQGDSNDIRFLAFPSTTSIQIEGHRHLAVVRFMYFDNETEKVRIP